MLIGALDLSSDSMNSILDNITGSFGKLLEVAVLKSLESNLELVLLEEKFLLLGIQIGSLHLYDEGQ